jgi:hypothetical protein
MRLLEAAGYACSRSAVVRSEADRDALEREQIVYRMTHRRIVDGGHRNPQLGGNGGQIAVTEAKPQVPSNAHDDHLIRNHLFANKGFRPVPRLRILRLLMATTKLHRTRDGAN